VNSKILFAGDVVNQCRQPVDIGDPELAVSLLKNSNFGKAIELACDSLAVRIVRLAFSACIGAGAILAILPWRVDRLASRHTSAWIRYLTARVLNSYTRVVSARISIPKCLSALSATVGSLRTIFRKVEADNETTRQLVRDSTLADRGRPDFFQGS
jgi:hypothetical protein